jgi:hypothetical protein
MGRTGIIFSYLIGVLLIILFIWSYNETSNDRKLLNKNGENITAIINKVVYKKRRNNFKYRFILKGKIYENWWKTYRSVEKGDSIVVTYYVKNPSINRPIID